MAGNHCFQFLHPGPGAGNLLPNLFNLLFLPKDNLFRTAAAGFQGKEFFLQLADFPAHTDCIFLDEILFLGQVGSLHLNRGQGRGGCLPLLLRILQAKAFFLNLLVGLAVLKFQTKGVILQDGAALGNLLNLFLQLPMFPYKIPGGIRDFSLLVLQLGNVQLTFLFLGKAFL